MVYLSYRGNVFVIGETIEDYIDNSNVILTSVSNNIKDIKLTLNSMLTNAGLDPRNLLHQVLYYAIAVGLKDVIKVSLDPTKDITEQERNNKLLLKKLAQDLVELLNQTLVADIDKQSLMIKIHEYTIEPLFEEYVTINDDRLITKATDVSDKLYNAIMANRNNFNYMKGLAVTLLANIEPVDNNE